jgi:hypothetical protein
LASSSVRLEFEVRRQLDLINQAMREDPSRSYSFEEHEASRNLMILFSRERTRSVQSQMSAAPLRRP